MKETIAQKKTKTKRRHTKTHLPSRWLPEHVHHSLALALSNAQPHTSNTNTTAIAATRHPQSTLVLPSFFVFALLSLAVWAVLQINCRKFSTSSYKYPKLPKKESSSLQGEKYLCVSDTCRQHHKNPMALG